MFGGCGVSVWDDDDVLAVAGGDGGTPVSGCLMPPSCALRVIRVVNFCDTYFNTHAHICNKLHVVLFHLPNIIGE